MEDITIKTLYFSFLFLLVSCGDSPFLSDESPVDDNVVGSQLLGSLSARGERFQFELKWLKGPKVFEESKVLLTVATLEGELATLGDDFKVVLWMPTMGHGSYPVKVKKLETGIYLLEEIFFTMGGLWDLYFETDQRQATWSITL